MDQFEWDILNKNNNPESFARGLCLDLVSILSKYENGN